MNTAASNWRRNGSEPASSWCWGTRGCGAIDITPAPVESASGDATDHVNAIIEAIRPAVSAAVAARGGDGRAAVPDAAVRANVRQSVAALRHGSRTLERLVREEGLMIVGAEYSLETGLVHFFEGAGDPG